MPTLTPTQSTSDDEWVVLEFVSTYRLPTRDNYRTNLQRWMSWCGDHGVSLLTARQADVESFLDFLRHDKELKESTVLHNLNTLSRFYKYAERAGKVSVSPTDYIKRPSVPRRATTATLTKTELLACLETARNKGNQEYLLWRLLSVYGLRIGEALSLDVTDVSSEVDGTAVNVFYRSSQQPAVKMLDAGTAELAIKVADGRAAGPLFRIRQGGTAGNRMDRPAAARMISTVAKTAGVTKKVTPQSLRATVIVLEHEAGTSVKDLQKALGLRSAKWVRGYRARGKRPRRS